MKILIVGNGAREHAILWKLKQDDPTAEFFVTRGNAGMVGLATSIPLDPTEIQALAGWALREKMDLTVVGPEVPLAEGIVDLFSAQGLPIFGPTRLAAEIESSKAFAKGLMAQYGIPTASFEIFTDAATASEYIRRAYVPIVVKASGLAAGKGAVVCETVAEALSTVEDILARGVFGAAGEQLVVEEYMRGEELSVFAVCDGSSIVTLLAAQDHERIGEGDTGPNTGGMGAYAPVSIATPELMQRIEREILLPTVRAMATEKRPYRGILYAGLMLTLEGPRVIEFNCRLGDPEAQVVLPLMQSSFLDIVMAVATGRPLADLPPVRWKERVAVATVVASRGYPGPYEKGLPIALPSDGASPEVMYFHAATEARKDDAPVTNGGRVLTVTALGSNIAEAAERSRSAAEAVRFEGRTFRRDIGWRELARA